MSEEVQGVSSIVILAVTQLYLWLFPQNVYAWMRSLRRVVGAVISKQLEILSMLHSRGLSRVLGGGALLLFALITRYPYALARRNRLSRLHSTHLLTLHQLLKRNRQKSPHQLSAGGSGRLRVLCVDGTGVRGVVAAHLLSRLLHTFPDLMHSVDLIAGASGGAPVALMLAGGVDPHQAVKVLASTAPTVFSNSPRRVLSGIGSLRRARYGQHGRQQVFDTLFGELSLFDLARPVMTTALEVASMESTVCRPTLLTNLQAPGGSQDCKLSDVAMRATATPTLFSSYQGFVDGGLFSLNPALMVLSGAASHGHAISEMKILSLSVGDERLRQPVTTRSDVDWGLLRWGPHIVQILFSSFDSTTELACESVLRDRYCRVRCELPRDLSSDAADRVDEMLRCADAVDLSAASEWIQEHWLS